MSPICRVILLLSAALLLQGASSRSALDVLRDLKNRIFIPANVPPPTQKPYPECSGLDQVNTTLNETQTVNRSLSSKEISETAEKSRNKIENEANTTREDSVEHLEEKQFATTATQSIANYKQYYDEQDWNTTTTNETQEKTEPYTESDYLTIVKNGTTDENEILTTQINVENTTQNETTQIKQDITHQTDTNVTLKAEGILTDKPVRVNTTVFTSKVENSTETDINGKSVIKIYNKTQLITDSLSAGQHNVTEQNTSKESLILLHQNKTDNNAEKNDHSNARIVTDLLFPDEVKDDSLKGNVTYIKDIFHSAGAERLGLERMIDKNSLKHVEIVNLNNGTILKPSNSTNVDLAKSNTSLESILPQTMIRVKETEGYTNNYENMTDTYQDETRSNTGNFERINVKDLNSSLADERTPVGLEVRNINTENEMSNKVKETEGYTNNYENMTGTYRDETRSNTGNFERINVTDLNSSLADERTPVGLEVQNINTENEMSKSDSNSTAKGETNLYNLENILLTSTKILEKFFQNFTNNLPTLEPEIIGSVSTRNDAELVKRSQQETDNYFLATTPEVSIEMLTNSTNENVTTSTDTNSTLHPNNEWRSVTDFGYNINKSIIENTTNNDVNDYNNTLKSLFVDGENEFVNSLKSNIDNKSLLTTNGSENLEKTTTECTNITINEANNPNLGNFSIDNKEENKITLSNGTGGEAENSGSVFNVNVTSNPNTTEEEFDHVGAGINTMPPVSDTVCYTLNQQCTNSKNCCEPLICITSNEENSTSYCDFRPPDPDLLSPLPDTRNLQGPQL